MNQQKSEIILVLDRSGSMESIKTDMEGGLKSFIEKQKLDQGECLVSLYQFDTIYEKVFEAVNVKEVKDIVLTPRGGTALNDAIGLTINAVGNRLKNTLENDRPGLVVFVVITDGEENSSHEFSGDKVKEMVKHQTEKYQWQFVFLGANQDAVLAGGALGISTSNSMSYGANMRGVSNMYNSLSANISLSKSAVFTSGVVKDVSFDEADRVAAMGDDILSKGNPIGATPKTPSPVTTNP